MSILSYAQAGRTALMIAATLGYADIVQVLRAAGASTETTDSVRVR